MQLQQGMECITIVRIQEKLRLSSVFVSRRDGMRGQRKTTLVGGGI